MGSEFCNKLSQQLHDAHDVEIRITSAGHPQSNGQAESAVKNIKSKMQAFMIEIGNTNLPNTITVVNILSPGYSPNIPPKDIH